MANSKITITFNNVPDLDSEIYFSDSLTPSLNMGETFKQFRHAPQESGIGTNINTTAFFYKDAFIWDYNQTILYTVTHNLNTVTIVANNPESQFTAGFNSTFGDVTMVIENEVPPVTFTLDSITILEANANPCDNVNVTITTNEQADNIVSPINQPVTTNPFTVTLTRQEVINISVEKDSAIVSDSIRVPKLLSTYFTISKIQTPSSASITVNNTLPSGILFSVEYSIDDVNWQTSTNFPNISFGDYTLYIRDNIGCSTSIDFSIDDFTPNLLDYDGVCEVSNINPIRYKEDVVWNDYVLKTPNNTLSFEENIRIPNRSFTQSFTPLDIIQTQIKTNYGTITATLIDESGTETPLLVEKRTNNMNIEDVRDAQIVSATYNGTQYAAAKFNGGKVYDPTTLAELTDYNIGENVPSWMNADDWLNIEGIGWYKVLDIIYSEDAYVVVLNLLANDFPFTLPSSKKVTSVYNVVDWENYEFDINFSDKDGYYQVKINCSDSNFGDRNYLSEWLSVKDTHYNTFLIEAYNSKNNEINFATGFKSTIRIPFVKRLTLKTNTEQEINVTDTGTTPLQNKYRQFWEFESNVLPTMMAEKLALILLQDRLFIDTVNYVVEGSIESVQVGGQYQIKANLVKSNYTFNSNSGKYVDLNTIEGTLLSISPGGGFLRVD